MERYIINNKNDKLIVFFGGWGCDYNPFKSIEIKDFDFIMLYDYNSVEFEELNFFVKRYKEINIVAWSMGVFFANVWCQKYSIKYKRAIAINGTLKPIDNKHGIPERLYDLTIKNFNISGRKLFFSRMFQCDNHLMKFNHNLPNRHIDNQKLELENIKKYYCENKLEMNNIYQLVILSKQDLIFPYKNLKKFWNGIIQVHEIDSGHFCFYNFESWKSIFINL